MRLCSEADIKEFLEVIESCAGGVYLKSPQGDIYNLNSSLSRYAAVGRLVGADGDALELFADRREDRAKLMNLVADLTHRSNTAA